jgi:hypothetical protein
MKKPINNIIMKRQIIILSVLFIFSIGVVEAQRGAGYHKDRWDKFRTEKIAFISSRLELTPTEAERFWPVYNQMNKKRREIQKLRRTIDERVRTVNDTLSEKEIIDLTRKYAESMQKEGTVQIEYNEKFLKILPPVKVLNLYKTEKEFRMYMIKKFRNHKKNGNSKMRN